MTDTIGISFQDNRKSVKSMLNRMRAASVQSSFPKTAEEVKAMTKEAQSIFLRAIQGKPMSWSGGTFTIFRVTGRLHGAVLGGLRYPYRGNPLSGALELSLPYWPCIKYGVRVHDMKPYLLNSPKAKIGKDGKRYVVVPIPIDPTQRFSARIFRVVKEGSTGWIYGGSKSRTEPYRGLKPRRVDLYVQEKLEQSGMKHRLIRALRMDIWRLTHND